MQSVALISAKEVNTIMIRITGLWMGIIAIVIGILILAVPDLLRWTLGIGFIVVGLLAIMRK
jgi:hypothetical protein